MIIVCGSDGDIGRAIVEALGRFDLPVIGISSKGLHTNGLLKSFTCDLSDLKALAEVSEKILDPRFVINCAGFYQKTSNFSFDEKVFKNNVGIADNILSVFTSKIVRGGRIITLASIDGKYPNTNSFSYSLAKGAVRNLVKLYKKKFKDQDINFDLISTGAVNTKMRKDKNENKEALVQPIDIAIVCSTLIAFTSNVSTEEIVIHPRSFTYEC